MGRNIGLVPLYRARNRCVEVSGEFSGTGVIIQKNLVITNYHLIEDKPDHQIQVEDRFVRRVLSFDLKYDFAALEVETKDIDPAKLATRCWRGQRVFYVGNPGDRIKAIQLGKILSVTAGRIDLEIECEEGFSGSGLYNSKGELIGLTDSFDPAEAGSCCKGYAIPTELILEHIRFANRKLKTG